MNAILFATIAFLAFATYEDVRFTDRGIKAGVAVEGNKLIVKLFGRKPTLRQSVIGALLYDGIVAIPATIGFVFGFFPLQCAGLGALITYGARRLYAVEKWKALK